MRNISDFDIIESVKRGNSADFSVLIDRYKNKAFSLLKRMLKNELDAEEVLQDCFLKAYNSLKGFKQESKFSTWFYKIVYNTALTRLSSRKRKIENEMSSVDDHFELEYKSNLNEFDNQEISTLLKKLISQLPENHAAVMSMFYLDEMSCEEISEVMNISVSNVKVILYRSRNSLKNIIIDNNLIEELL
ncbi:MAG TPA: RNA polymerase sigma factor [Ignavibacteriaceae bacterium]|nr:RNA polymerase sigma factor [Ignavibacteriaceae bacterium]